MIFNIVISRNVIIGSLSAELHQPKTTLPRYAPKALSLRTQETSQYSQVPSSPQLRRGKVLKTHAICSSLTSTSFNADGSNCSPCPRAGTSVRTGTIRRLGFAGPRLEFSCTYLRTFFAGPGAKLRGRFKPGRRLRGKSLPVGGGGAAVVSMFRCWKCCGNRNRFSNDLLRRGQAVSYILPPFSPGGEPKPGGLMS